MTSAAIDTKAAVEVAKSAAGLPQEGKTFVLDHLVSDMTPEALKALSSEARGKLLQALAGTEASPSSTPKASQDIAKLATKSPAVGAIKTIDTYQAVVGQITVNGQQLDTLLSEGSFGRSQSGQQKYAAKLGYRTATRAENRAYVDSLLAKERDETFNGAEANALKTYRDRFVRDDQGGLVPDGQDFYGIRVNYWNGDVFSHHGALFVRASEESKQVQELEALLKKVSAPSATTSPAVSEIKTIDNHQAVVGQITVNGKQLDTLLSEGCFNKSRPDLHKYAAKLDCRMATQEENLAYVKGLLAKEGNGTINDAEKNALQTYRDGLVRDTEGGLGVDGRSVRAREGWYGIGVPGFAALFVRDVPPVS